MPRPVSTLRLKIGFGIFIGVVVIVIGLSVGLSKNKDVRDATANIRGSDAATAAPVDPYTDEQKLYDGYADHTGVDDAPPTIAPTTAPPTYKGEPTPAPTKYTDYCTDGTLKCGTSHTCCTAKQACVYVPGVGASCEACTFAGGPCGEQRLCCSTGDQCTLTKAIATASVDARRLVTASIGEGTCSPPTPAPTTVAPTAAITTAQPTNTTAITVAPTAAVTAKPTVAPTAATAKPTVAVTTPAPTVTPTLLKIFDVCTNNVECFTGLCDNGVCKVPYNMSDNLKQIAYGWALTDAVCATGLVMLTEGTGSCVVAQGGVCTDTVQCGVGNTTFNLCSNGVCKRDAYGACAVDTDCGVGACIGGKCLWHFGEQCYLQVHVGATLQTCESNAICNNVCACDTGKTWDTVNKICM